MRIMIAVPCMDMVHAQFTSSLCNLLLYNHDDEVCVEFGVSSLIYDTRNMLIEKAINEKFDRVLWLDSDMVFEPEILRILNADLEQFDIVSGLYFKRVKPITPVVYKRCEIERLEDNKLKPVSEPYNEYPQNCIFEIAACGFGCVAMNVSALESIVEAYGKMLFSPVTGFGEDMSFCMRARSAGVKLWCDPRIKLGHIGYHVFDEAIFLKESQDEREQ